jgi:hypothetical protein
VELAGDRDGLVLVEGDQDDDRTVFLGQSKLVGDQLPLRDRVQFAGVR